MLRPHTGLPSATVPAVVMFGLTVLLLLNGRRKRSLVALASISMGVVLMASCGGGGGSGGGGTKGTPSGTYTIVVTATNGTKSESTNLTLNVN